MPSCYNWLLNRHDLHQNSFCKPSVLFREVLWHDCILPGCCTPLPSRYNLLLHRHDLHQKSFCKSSVLELRLELSSCNLLLHWRDLHNKSFFKPSVLFREVIWLNFILPGCCTPLPSRYNLLLHRHDLHQKSFCE